MGGRKAAATNKKRYGKDFYKVQGAKGGAVSSTGGFFSDRELASRAGALGGKKSKRGPARPKGETELNEQNNEQNNEEDGFLIIDEQIDSPTFEPFNKESFFKGWFKRKDK